MGYVAAIASMAMSVVGGIAGVYNAKNEAKAMKRTADVNAQVYEQQAEMVKNQMRVKEWQSNRQMARYRGAVIAKTGKAGFNLSGSPLAVLVDNETNMQLDKEAGLYNLDVQRSYLKTAANYTRWGARVQSKIVVRNAWSNLWSKTLGGIMGAAGSMGGGMGGMAGMAGGLMSSMFGGGAGSGVMASGVQSGAGSVIGTTAGYGVRGV